MAGSSHQRHANKVKIAVIPLLAVVLVYLVFGSRDEKQNQTVPGAAPGGTATSAEEVSARPIERPVAPPRIWPDKSLAEILKHDPFRPRQQAARAAQPSARTVAAKVQTERDRKVSEFFERFSKVPDLVLQSRHGMSAIIDGQTLRVGDVLDGTTRVVAIHPDGIVFELLESN